MSWTPVDSWSSADFYSKMVTGGRGRTKVTQPQNPLALLDTCTMAPLALSKACTHDILPTPRYKSNMYLISKVVSVVALRQGLPVPREIAGHPGRLCGTVYRKGCHRSTSRGRLHLLPLIRCFFLLYSSFSSHMFNTSIKWQWNDVSGTCGVINCCG